MRKHRFNMTVERFKRGLRGNFTQWAMGISNELPEEMGKVGMITTFE